MANWYMVEMGIWVSMYQKLNKNWYMANQSKKTILFKRDQAISKREQV